MGAALTALSRAYPVRQVSVRSVDIRGGLKTDHFKYSTDCFSAWRRSAGPSCEVRFKRPSR